MGTHAHVLLGGGYLGTAYVDYGLGNFAFYDNSPPENASGSLVVTATGRHIDNVTWRPATIVDDLPQPLTGAAATSAVAAWNQRPVLHRRRCHPGAVAGHPGHRDQPAQRGGRPAADRRPWMRPADGPVPAVRLTWTRPAIARSSPTDEATPGSTKKYPPPIGLM